MFRPHRKLLHRLLFAGLAFALAASPSHSSGQGFTFANGASASPLITLEAGHVIGGLSADAKGDLYYFDNGPTDNRLMVRASNGSVSTLLTLGSSSPGNALRVFGSQIYTTTGTGGNILVSKGTLSADGFSLMSGTTQPLATINAAYDLAVAPNGGLYVSAATFGQKNNRVFELNTTTGALTTVLNAAGDYSGPIAVNPENSRYYYGASGFGDVPGAIYEYTQADLGGNQVLTLDGAHRQVLNGSNGSLAAGPGGLLYQTSGTSLNLYDFSTGVSPAFLGAASGFDYTSYLTLGGSQLYFSVTDYGSFTSAVFALPEPDSALLLAFGGALALNFRQRRAGSFRA